MSKLPCAPMTGPSASFATQCCRAICRFDPCVNVREGGRAALTDFASHFVIGGLLHSLMWRTGRRVRRSASR
jgi:hypothetical protein